MKLKTILDELLAELGEQPRDFSDPKENSKFLISILTLGNSSYDNHIFLAGIAYILNKNTQNLDKEIDFARQMYIRAIKEEISNFKKLLLGLVEKYQDKKEPVSQLDQMQMVDDLIEITNPKEIETDSVLSAFNFKPENKTEQQAVNCLKQFTDLEKKGHLYDATNDFQGIKLGFQSFLYNIDNKVDPDLIRSARLITKLNSIFLTRQEDLEKYFTSSSISSIQNLPDDDDEDENRHELIIDEDEEELSFEFQPPVPVNEYKNKSDDPMYQEKSFIDENLTHSDSEEEMELSKVEKEESSDEESKSKKTSEFNFSKSPFQFSLPQQSYPLGNSKDETNKSTYQSTKRS